MGRRYRLLEVLGRSTRPLSSATLARRANTDASATRLWCEAAAAVGLLRLGSGRYALPRNLVPLLVDDGHPAYLGGHVSYLALRSLDFESFDELFRHGAVSARPQRHLVQAFAEATRYDHTAFLEILLPRQSALARSLARGCAVLDVGAGAGRWEFRVAARFPKATFLGLEPNRTALRLADAEAARRGLDDRVRFVIGDAEGMRFNGLFDLVYLGEMLCNGPSDPRAVLAACRRALRPGGRLVVCEGLVEEDKGPRDAGNQLILPMQLEFALQPARFLGKRELARLLMGAGFVSSSFVAAGGGLWFAVARTD